ncbi:MAG: DUF4345 domain-containing protein [Pseudomonadota bacterium]
MHTNLLQKLTLGLAGVTAASIGLMIAVVPHAFYESYGIALGTDPNLLSELRAPGAGLAVLGFVTILGAFQRDLTRVAVVIAFAIFAAFPAGRLISLLADGMPNTSIAGAMIIEIVILGMLVGAFVFGRDRRSAISPAE